MSVGSGATAARSRVRNQHQSSRPTPSHSITSTGARPFRVVTPAWPFAVWFALRCRPCRRRRGQVHVRRHRVRVTGRGPRCSLSQPGIGSWSYTQMQSVDCSDLRLRHRSRHIPAGGGCAGERSRLMGISGSRSARNRFYDPTTGTFLSPDPVDGSPGTPDEANPYDYVGNDPLNFVDPLGLCRTTDVVFGPYQSEDPNGGLSKEECLVHPEVDCGGARALVCGPRGPTQDEIDAARGYTCRGADFDWWQGGGVTNAAAEWSCENRGTVVPALAIVAVAAVVVAGAAYLAGYCTGGVVICTSVGTGATGAANSSNVDESLAARLSELGVRTQGDIWSTTVPGRGGQLAEIGGRVEVQGSTLVLRDFTWANSQGPSLSGGAAEQFRIAQVALERLAASTTFERVTIYFTRLHSGRSDSMTIDLTRYRS